MSASATQGGHNNNVHFYLAIQSTFEGGSDHQKVVLEASIETSIVLRSRYQTVTTE